MSHDHAYDITGGEQLTVVNVVMTTVCYQGFTPLHLAAQRGHDKVIYTLVKEHGNCKYLYIYFINIDMISKGLVRMLGRIVGGYQLICSRQLHLKPPEVSQFYHHGNYITHSHTVLLETGLKDYGLRRKPVAEGILYCFFQTQNIVYHETMAVLQQINC